MLYKNHQKVSLVDDPFYKSKKEEFEALIKGRQYVTFRTNRPIRINPTGWTEPHILETIPVEVIIPNHTGDDVDHWIYTTKAPKVKQNGEKDYDKRPIMLSHTLVVRTTERDKIFYLLYLSGTVSGGRIHMINEAREAEDKVRNISKASAIDFFLTNEFSPLSKDHMRRIAKAFGVEKVDEITDAQVILGLKHVVETAESQNDTNRNIAAFMKAMDIDDMTNTKAMIQEAIDEGKIKFNDQESYFYYANQDGEYVEKIIQVPLLDKDSKIKRMNVIQNFISNNDKERGKLQRLLEYSTREIDFSKCDYTLLKKFAAQHDISAKGKMEELVERISEDYERRKHEVKFDLSYLLISDNDVGKEE